MRGTVVSATAIAHLTAAQLDAAAADFPGAPRSSYGVTAYRLIYRTVDPSGRPTTASGIVVLPDARKGALTVAEYLHGTNPTKAYAASVDDTSTDRLVTALFAGQGLVGVAPDYLGPDWGRAGIRTWTRRLRRPHRWICCSRRARSRRSAASRSSGTCS